MTAPALETDPDRALQLAWSATAAMEADDYPLANEIIGQVAADALTFAFDELVAVLLQVLRNHCPTCGHLEWVRDQALHALDHLENGPERPDSPEGGTHGP